MASNSFGKILVVTTFGESHGVAIGGVLDGFPAGIKIDFDFVQAELQRRKPGQSNITTQRKEEDQVQFLSGIFEGVSTGHPIAFTIANNNAKSNDYEHIKETFRPSHADFTYQEKYGARDYRGGGRSSARETACRVVAGALAKLLLNQHNITINAYVQQVGTIACTKNYTELDLSKTESNVVRCPDATTAQKMINLIEETKKNGDTIGGVVQCVVQGLSVGLGEPIYNKLHTALGAAMLSINAVKGFEYGSGFEGATQLGSQQNDVFVNENNKVTTKTNNSGGIQGGISNGQDIYFRVAFKPVATIMQNQQTIKASLEEVNLQGKGRHDPCVVPRAVPIVEAMTALVLADFLLLAKTSKV
jgi:chorismate synthase